MEIAFRGEYRLLFGIPVSFLQEVAIFYFAGRKTTKGEIMSLKNTRRMISAMFFLLLFAAAAAAMAAGQSPVGQYEVKVYTERDYVGQSKSYVLNKRTHRIVLVNKLPANLDNAISSIHVGSEVFAILFDYHDFHISLGSGGGGGNWLTGLVKAIVDIHLKMTPLGYLPKGKSSSSSGSGAVGGMGLSQPGTNLMGNINVGVYTGSTPMVLHNDIYTSMIIIPKDFDYAYGVALYNYADRFIRVEPIADEKKFKERRIPDFGSYLNNKIDHVAFLGPRIKNTTITLYDDPNYKGASITLPGEGSDVLSYDLHNYSFASKTQSIRLRVEPIKKNVTKAVAPPADEANAQEIVTVIPLILPGIMATAVEAAPLEKAKTAGNESPAQQSQQGQQQSPQQSKQPAQGQKPGGKAGGEGQQQAGETPTPGDPGKVTGWGQKTGPGIQHEEPVEDPDRPREEEEQRREDPDLAGWTQHPEPEPHEEELPPGMPDMRGRWRDNHGNFFEIIQHGPSFVLLGDGVPVHGAGILLEPGRIGLVVQAEGEEVMHLEGHIEHGEHEGPVERIVLDNGIVLER